MFLESNVLVFFKHTKLTLYVTVLHICNKHKEVNSVLLNFTNFHLEVVETLSKMNTKSKGNRKRKSEVEEGIEEKNIKGILSICLQNQRTEIKLGTSLIG